ncbi:hypothetical protein BDV3_002764 [Batrachochytrium dendrobatidis]
MQSLEQQSVQKKNKRGRRGGKKQHEPHPDTFVSSSTVSATHENAAFDHDTTCPTTKNSNESIPLLDIIIDPTGNADSLMDSNHKNDRSDDDQNNPPRKKTRRSKRGKTAHFPEPDFMPQQETVQAAASSEIKWSAASTDPSTLFNQTDTDQKDAIDPVDPDLRQYFENIEKMLEEQEFETPSDLHLFINNVYSEIRGKELLVSGDFATSRVLEKLLRGSSDVQVRLFLKSVSGCALKMFMHQFASHVMQTALGIAAGIVDREVRGESKQAVHDSNDEPVDEEFQALVNDLPSMETLLLSLCEELKTEWSNLLLDPYGSHVVQTLLNVLSGQTLADEIRMRSRKSSNYNKNHNNFSNAKQLGTTLLTPASFAKLQAFIVDSLSTNLKDTDLREMAFHPIANPVLQILLEIPQSSDSLIAAFLKDGSFFDSLLEHHVGSHLAERLVSKASADTFKILYNQHIRPKFLALCNHQFANFIIQRTVSKVSTESQLVEMLDIVEPHFARMLFQSRAGIILKIVESCITFPNIQPRIMACLYKAFEVDEDEEKKKMFATLVLHLSTYDRFQQFVRLPNVQGALIIQHICSYSAHCSKPCLDSILSISKQDMLKWISDPISSRVIESILSSATIAVKFKRRLIRIFFGSFVDLSIDKYGSHFVDKCWAVASLDARQTIVEELAERLPTLLGNFHAKFIVRNCSVELFKRNRGEWMEKQRIEISRRDKVESERIKEAENSAAANASVDATPVCDDPKASDMTDEKKSLKQKKKNSKKAKIPNEIDDLFAKKLK